jgi:signal transduction histidine kinase
MISDARLIKAKLPAEALETLCSQLSQGMHAAAQPLTILLSSLSKANTDQMSTAELRELTESSAVQVQRVCTLFRYLQQLLLSESARPQLCPTPILPLLAHVVEGVDLLFRKAGVSLSTSTPDNCQPVLIDRARTIQALTSVLLIAHAVSSARDTVELILTSSPDRVQIVVRNLNSPVEGMNAEGSLIMAVAEANMRSQQAGFSLSLGPFHVKIELQEA